MPSTKKRKPGPKPSLFILPAELRRRRIEAGLEVAQLATLAGIQPNRIYQLERGHKPGVTIRTAKSLAQHLDCNFKDITEVLEQAS